MYRITSLAPFVVMAVVLTAACGSGGSGSATSPPAFTDLAGTRWNQTDTVSAANSCNVGLGVTDTFVLHMLAQSGNTLSVYDERSGASSAANATLSGYVITYSGTRYPVGGCSSMTASYTVTIDKGETSYSGSATISCADNGCTVPVTVSGTKL